MAIIRIEIEDSENEINMFLIDRIKYFISEECLIDISTVSVEFDNRTKQEIVLDNLYAVMKYMEENREVEVKSWLKQS